MVFHRSILIPVSIAIVMTLVILGTWRMVENNQQIHLGKDTQNHLNSLAARLETNISTRLNFGLVIRKHWQEEEIETKEMFQYKVRDGFDLFPDFQAINWIDPEGVIRWVFPYKGNELAQGLNIQKRLVPSIALAEAERTGQLQTTPPIKLAQGGKGFIAFIPLMANGSLEGFIDLVFKLEPLIEAAIRKDFFEFYHLKITDENETVFDSQNMQAPHMQVVQKQIKAGSRTWQMFLMPTPKTIEASLTITDELVLIIGLLVTVGTTMLVRMFEIERLKLEKSETRLRGAIESLEEGFVLFDQDDRLLMANDVYQEINPKAREYLKTGMRFEDLIRANVSEGKMVEAHGREEEFIRERLELHRNPKGPIIRQFSDGKWYILKETRTPEGGTALTFTDITEIKKAEEALRESDVIRKSEERLRTMIETNPAGVAIISTKTNKRLYINRAMAKLFGAKTAEQLMKHDLKTTYANHEDLDSLRSKSGNEFINEAEIERVRLDGTKWWCLMNRRRINFEGEEALIIWHYDITNRRQAEDQVKLLNEGLEILIEKRTIQVLESERRFKDFAEAASDWFWEMDADLQFTYFSDRYQEITHFDPADRLGTQRIDHIHPSEGKKISQIWTAHMADLEARKPFKDFEYASGSTSKHIRHVRISGIPIFNDEGNFQGYRGTGTDITELKKTEEALRRSEEHFRNVINNSPTFITLKDTHGRFILANQTYANLVGLNPENIEGKYVSEVFPEKIAKDSVAHDQKVIETRSVVVEERQIITKNGDFNFLVIKFPILDESGAVKEIGTIGTDITQRKKTEEALRKSEERFRSAFVNVAIGNIVINNKGIIEVFNAAAEDIFGYSGDEVVGRGVGLLMPEHEQNRHNGYMQKYFKTGEGKIIGIGREVTGLRKNGEEFPMYLGVGEIQIGDQVSFVGSITDMTTVKKLEQQLQQSQKMEAVGQLTGGVAHDFNNLLAVISGNLELLDDTGGLDDKSRKMLSRAMDAVQKGADLTDQLLIFSRQQTLNPKTIDPNNLLFDTIKLLQRTLGEDIDIKMALGTQVPLIRVDPGMLGNAVINMANNARDAMPNGGTLTIKTAGVHLDKTFLNDDQSPSTGPHTLISISDTGKGIKKKDLEHVFEPFFTTKSVGKGTGLGLSTVHGFVKQSGGHVTINSKRGKGTTIILYFPAAGDLDAEAVETATSPKAEPKGAETILVVEDDEDVRLITVAMLNQLGYTVKEAEDGPSALKVLGKNGNGIDLVFSDVVMPSGMSGIDLANELRRRFQNIKVLITSGYPDKVIDKISISKMEIRLLKKPYKKTDLAEAVRGALGS